MDPNPRPRLTEVCEAANPDECFAVFRQVESFSRTEEENKKLRRLSLIDEGWVPRLTASLLDAKTDQEKVAALAALSELAFGVSDRSRIAAFFDGKQSGVGAVISAFAGGSTNPAASIEIRVWASIAICNANSEGSWGLEKTWQLGAVKVALTFLAAYIAAKHCAAEAGICVKGAGITDFSVCPEYEHALVSIAAEPFVTPSYSLLSPTSSSSRSPLKTMASITAAATPASTATSSEFHLCRETEILQKAMSLGPHRIAMNCLGLMVMFSRDETMMPRIREMRLEDCSPYYQLLKDRGASFAGLLDLGADQGSQSATINTEVNKDPGRVHHLGHIASSQLFDDDTTALDLALHAVESLDLFYSHIAASVVAYLAGADETDPFRLGADDEAHESAENTTGAGATVGGAAATASAASPDPAMRSPSTRGRALHGKASFARAQSQLYGGLPSQCVSMLIEAATAALRNETYRGFAAYRKLFTYLRPLAVIAIADANKVTILKQGGVSVALQSLGHPDERSRQFAAQLLWLLAFNKDAKEEILKTKGSLEALRNAAKIGTGAARMNALGALWQIQAKEHSAVSSSPPAPASSSSAAAIGETGILPCHISRPSAVAEAVASATLDSDDDRSTDSDASFSDYESPRRRSGDSNKDDERGHLMLSYSWSEQPLVVAVKQELSHLGYKVWLDLIEMRGSTLEAMADAVEKASAVIIFCSQKYRQSPNCRSEAEYAFKLRKQIIPVMTQEGYTPDGWLGIIIGSRLYFDLSQCAIASPSTAASSSSSSSASLVGAASTATKSILDLPPRWLSEDAARIFEEKMRLLVKELGNRGKIVMNTEKKQLSRRSRVPSAAAGLATSDATSLVAVTSSFALSSALPRDTARFDTTMAAAATASALAETSAVVRAPEDPSRRAVYDWALASTGSNQVAQSLLRHDFDEAALGELRRLCRENEELFLRLCKDDLGVSLLGPRLRLMAALRKGNGDSGEGEEQATGSDHITATTNEKDTSS
jgi:TIR domain